MILFEGNLLPDEELDNVLKKLWDSCVAAVSEREHIAERVICACGNVAEKIRAGVYDNILSSLLENGAFTKGQLDEAIAFFDKENLRLKYDIELGTIKQETRPWRSNSAEISKSVVTDVKREEQATDKECHIIDKKVTPLGILFHIAAGNAEGLPFFSVIEGLLAGNVNILKLPSMDDGISIMLLHEMIKEEPALAPYVCVLDVPSTNVKILKTLADMADAIVVWGGDAAVAAARNMASPETQIISWGHKLSFAYVSAKAVNALSGDDMKSAGEWEMEENGQATNYEQELYDLAHHICATNQLLCSSCQGIFIDTENEADVMTFAQEFLHILEEVSVDYPQEKIGVRGKVSISLYNEELESTYTGHKVLRGKEVSVIAATDSKLELSYMFKNCWVKPLPRKNIIKALKGKKGHLQTVGLICADSERDELADVFTKAGLTHIARPKNMSQMLPGGTHDGEYPLRRYSRIVEVER